MEEKLNHKEPLLNEKPADNSHGKKWAIGVRVKIFSIGHLNTGSDSNYQISFSLKYTWYSDKHLNNEKGMKLDYLNQSELELPEIQIMGVESSTIDKCNLSIKKGGLVNYTTKYVALIKENFDLRHFPFDSQVINLRLRATQENQSIWFRESFNPKSNKQYIFNTDLSGFDFNTEHTRIVVRNSPSKADWILQVVYKRSRQYYYSHLFLPLFVLQFFTFFIQGINPIDSFADSINIILISLLTTTALRYSLSDVLPQVSYITMADLYILCNFVVGAFLGAFEFAFLKEWLPIGQRAIFIGATQIIWLLFTVFYFIFGTSTDKINEQTLDKRIENLGSKASSFVVKKQKSS